MDRNEEKSASVNALSFLLLLLLLTIKKCFLIKLEIFRDGTVLPYCSNVQFERGISTTPFSSKKKNEKKKKIIR